MKLGNTKFPLDLSWANNSTVLLTGGSGSFGKEFVRTTLQNTKIKKIIIYSRDEMKQWEMAKSFPNEERIRFFIGDVRDKERLDLACHDVDYIVHAAALKIIPTAEYNPFECIRTNIEGARNVILCALQNGVKKVIALSTDKACNPVNLYGATKLCSDKLFIAGNSYAGARSTSFSVVRYGNVIGSRGSVIPLFLSQASKGVLSITDERMTRFMLTLQEAVELVWFAIQDSSGGEIYIPKIPSMKIIDIAKAVAPEAEISFIGMRPGEKLHEEMISEVDARNTIEYENHFKIMSEISKSSSAKITKSEAGTYCHESFRYASNINSQWMSEGELRTWIKDNNLDQNDSPQGHATLNKVSAKKTIVIDLDEYLLSKQDIFGEEINSIVNLFRESKYEQTLQSIEALENKELREKEEESLGVILLKALSQNYLGFSDQAIKTLAIHLSHTPQNLLVGRLLSSIIEQEQTSYT
jgi:UDP-N-acetylglucosamine 4,6-dehydratase/5-epimerase